jgi:hypothetical protein
MSDMLQLVVEIGNIHATILRKRRTLSVAKLNDKLKHVVTVDQSVRKFSINSLRQ